MAVSQIIGASIADGTIAAIDITDGTITTAKLAATTGSGNVVLSAAPTLTGNTSLVNLTVSGTQTNSTLTSGRVRYSTTGGLLTDSSNLQFDGTNLGVGVTPSSWFTVFKAVQIGGNFSGTPFAGALTGQTNDAAIALYNNAYINTSAVETYYSSSSHGAAKYRLNANVHEWFTAPVGTAGNAITFTQAMTLDASGYLGIGTTTPSSYGGLAVRKAATVSSVPVSASFSDSANSTFDIRHSPNIVNLNAQGSGITINTGNSTRITITDAGNVGIGTTSPAAKLDLGGNTASTVQQIFGRGVTDTDFTVRYTNGAAGTSAFIGTLGLDYANGTFADMATIKFYRNSVAGELAFFASASGVSGTEKLRITSTTLHTANGISVGIGTDSPYGLLNIKGSNGQLVLANGNTSGGMKLTASNSIYTGNGYLAFEGYANEYGRFDSSGNFGIGTTSPIRPLQVGAYGSTNGEIALASTTSGYGSILFGDGSSGTDYYRGYLQYNHTSDAMLLATSALERMIITSTGNIGIGTSSPDSFTIFPSKLVVGSGSGNQQITVYSGTSSEGNLIFADGTTESQQYMGVFRYDHADNAMKFYVNGGTEGMRIRSNGSVVVGDGATTSDRLFTVDTGGGETVGAVFRSKTGASSSIGFRDNSGSISNDYTVRIGSSGNALVSYTSGEEKMRINSYGQLGVGTTMTGILSTTPGIFINGISGNQPDIQSLFVSGAKIGFAGISSLIQNQLCVYDSTGANPVGSGGAIVFGGNAGNGQGTFYCAIESSKDNGTAGDYGASLRFYTRPSGSYYTSPNMIISSAGLVGIGTTSPNTLLTAGATTLTGAEISTYTTSTAGGDSSKFSFWRNYTNGSSAPFRAAYISNINSDDSYNGANAQFLGFFTKSGTAEPVERMRITSVGDVLVGTTSLASSGSNVRAVVAGRHWSFNGELSSLASGTAYTMFTMTADFATYIVTASGIVSSAAYSETAIVHINNTSVTTTVIADGSVCTISNSGLNVQYTQSSGVSMGSMAWSVIRIL